MAECAVVFLRDPRTGDTRGRVDFLAEKEGDDRLLVVGYVEGLTPGAHGMHVHEYGDDSAGCKSAGEHYNPADTRHGGLHSLERHTGDYGNVWADARGFADVHFITHDTLLSELYGRMLVVHAEQDDLGQSSDAESGRTGNSGARVACGVIARGPCLPDISFQSPNPRKQSYGTDLTVGQALATLQQVIELRLRVTDELCGPSSRPRKQSRLSRGQSPRERFHLLLRAWEVTMQLATEEPCEPLRVERDHLLPFLDEMREANMGAEFWVYAATLLAHMEAPLGYLYALRYLLEKDEPKLRGMVGNRVAVGYTADERARLMGTWSFFDQILQHPAPTQRTPRLGDARRAQMLHVLGHFLQDGPPPLAAHGVENWVTFN